MLPHLMFINNVTETYPCNNTYSRYSQLNAVHVFRTRQNSHDVKINIKILFCNLFMERTHIYMHYNRFVNEIRDFRQHMLLRITH